MLFLQSHPTPEQHKMREEDHTNWFSRWDDQLPSPEELTPLTQSLITPDLALAFDITPNPTPPISNPSPHPLPPPPSSQPTSNSAEFADSAEMTPGGAGPDEPARTLKRPRLVWTPQLHKRFVDAVAHLGIKNAVPKTIMQLMSVDGLTRENVASHLQKYRLYLKRMQGLSAGGGAAGAGGGIGTDAATEHLFASAPVPHHFLHRGGGGPVMPPTAAAGGGGEHYLPQFVPVAALHHQHHMAAAAAVAAAAQQQQFQQHQRHMGHFGSPPGGQFEHHGFLARQPQAVHRMVGPAAVPGPAPPGPVYVEDLESGGAGGTRKVLTLFPTGED